MTKSHTGDFTVGQQGDYTISVANTGDAATFGTITIVDTLPTGLSFVQGTGSDWSCSQAGQIVTCTSSDVIPPSSVDPTIDLKVSVTATTPGTITNTATASGGGATNTATANDPTTIDPSPPILAITKSHSGNFTVGTTGTYTIVPSNSGQSNTSGTVSVIDTLPTGLTYNSASGTGWTCSASGQTVTCTSTTVIAAGTNGHTITLNVNVASAAVPSVTNTVSATGGGAGNSPTANDPTTVAGAPVLQANKSHSGNFVIGTNATYTLSVGNTGNAPTTGTLTYTDTLPSALTYVSATGTGWTCSASGQVVTCTTTTAINNGSTSPAITLTVLVGGTAGSVTNTAVASGGGAGGTSTANNPTTLVNNAAGAGGSKTHVGNFVVGSNGVYTITPTNTGVQPSSGTVTVTDTLPTGLTYVSATGTDWTCGNAGQVVTCTSTDVIAAGTSGNPITLTVAVGIGAFPNVTNTANIAFNSTSFNASNPTQVDNGPRLVATKTHSGNFADGTNGVWTIGLSNTGSTATTADITLTDTLQTGLTYVSATGSGWTCSASGQVVTCTSSTTLSSGSSLPNITLTVLPGPASVGTFTNTVIPSGGGAAYYVNGTNSTKVNGVPQVGLTKTHSGTFYAGLPATYTLTPSNPGSAATTGTLTVVDTLPTGLTYQAASGVGWTCSASGQVVTCTSPVAIAAGANGNTIGITVLPLPSAVPSVTNSATLSGGGASNPSTATDPTTVAIAPVLGISKTHSGNFVAGQNGTYTITPINSGYAATSGTYTIVDTLPAGLTYVSAGGTGWSCANAAGTITCTSSTTINASGIGNPISVVVSVAASAVPTVTNTASSSGGGAPNNGSATDVTTVTIPVLAIAKSHVGNFVVGGSGSYTIAVSNTGNATTFGTTTVVDTLPTGLTYASATGTGWTCSDSAQVVTCTSTATIAASAAFPSIALGVTIPSGTTPGSVTNSATASGGGAVNTPTATDPTTLAQPALAITKSHSGSFPVGGSGTYTIAVSNTGNATTFGTTTVVDTLPTGMTYASATGSGWTCSDAAQVVTCTSTATIAASAAFPSITLGVTIPSSTAPATLTNSATASGGGATNTPTATDPTTISGAPALTIAKSHTGNFTIGSTGTYTIAVGNSGNIATSGTITVTDTLPAGLTYNAASGTGWTCSGSGTNATCTSTTVIGASAAGNPISLTVNVIGPAGGVTNSANASGGGASNTPVATDPTTLVGNPVLAIAKSHTGSFTAGGTGTYTIAVSNTGNVATSGTVTVTDTLPTGLTYNAASGTGWSCSGSGASATCTSTTAIAPSGSGNPITLTVNVAASAPASVTNSASATGGGASNTPVATDPTTILSPVLAVTKSHTGNFTIGTPGTYTIAVSNTGTAATSGTITIVDTLPTGLTYNAASGTGWSCSGSGQTATCTSATSIAASGSGNPIALTVNVLGPPGMVTNSVTASGGGATNTPIATNPTIINGSPVLAIAKTHTGTFTVGSTGTYTIAVSNSGNVATSGTISVTDTIPTGLTYNAASGTGWTCSGSGQTATCTSATPIAASAAGAPIALTVNVVGPAGSVINSASASGGGASNTPVATDPTMISGMPALAITKTHTGSFTAGGTGTYTIAVSNTGNVATSGTVTMTDTLPTGLTYNAATGTGWTCTGSGVTVSCTSTTAIAASGSGNPITLTVNVAPSAPASVINSATVTGGGASNTPVATDPTTIVHPVLAVTKTHTGTFTIGATGTYTIAVSNTGTGATVGNVTIVDTLPTGLTFNAASGTGWTCSGSAGTATCSTASVIAAGATANPITLTVNVVGPPGPVVNSVTASGGSATNSPVATDPTVIAGTPSLSIAKSHTGNFTVGSPGVYTILVSNSGTAATSGTIVVTDPLPAGLTFTSATGTGWTCTSAAPTVTCSSTTVIPAGGTGTPITITVGVAAAAVPHVTNSATASGGGATNTPVATDPTTVGGTVTITGLSGTSIDKFVNNVRSISAAPGSSVTYTIGFVNTGTVDATNVTLTDPFPAGVTPILSTVTLNGATTGFSASVSGQTLTVTIPVVHVGVPQTIAVGANVSSSVATGQTFVNVGTITATGVAPINTTPATVFNGSANIVYDGTKGSAAPIGGASIALVDPTTGKPIVLDRTRAGVPPSTSNPQTTAPDGTFSFALPPAAFGAPGGSETYHITASAHGFQNRSIQAVFSAEPSGLLYSVTLTSLDGQPLAIEGGFTLVTRPTTIANVLNLINNIPMFPTGALQVQKIADRTTVSVGDRIVYTVTITASQPFGATRIVDQLPPGLAYAPHSGTFDGAALEPTISGLTQVWEIPALSAGVHTLRYAVVVGPSVGLNAKLTNLVDVTAANASGGTVSGSAQATVQTVAGAFSDRLTILGRVVVGSSDGGWTSVSHGVAGVRIVMEDGTTVVTDAQGRYSFQEVHPGAHVLRLDTSSLPAGIRSFGSHAYNDPTSTVRLVHTLMDTRLIQDVIFVVEEQQ